MPSDRRIDRLEHRLKRDIATLIQGELKDPRLGFCTVTRVQLAKDLSLATVYVSVMAEKAAQRKCLRALQDASGFVSTHVARDLHAYQTPRVRFKLDESIAKSFHINDLIRQAVADLPPEERAAGPRADDDGPRADDDDPRADDDDDEQEDAEV